MDAIRLTWLRSSDWLLVGAVLLPIASGLVTMKSFGGASPYFEKQILWFVVSINVLLLASRIDWRFLRETRIVVIFFLISVTVLLLLLFFGTATRGVRGWFVLGPVSIQPIDFIRIVLIILLAKYFTRRHIEIARIRHLLISGMYAGTIALLVLLQPDFGSVAIISLIWLGMVVVSGISKKQLFIVFVFGAVIFTFLWMFGLEAYQKQRIISFLHPLSDIQGSGYNTYQSVIAVGSGGIFGKGVGFGSQSRLQFLPAAHTDFIFAAFAEEWGFVGVVMLVSSFGVLIWRILKNASEGASNFESFFMLGTAILFTAHFFINVGMNLGLLPVTGVTLPFMSYGGSHLLSECLLLGIICGMRRYRFLAGNSIREVEVLLA